MTVAWAKENGLLPAGRAADDGRGVLIITSVRTEDSGTYVCTATAGRFVKTETAVLNVGGGGYVQPGRKQTFNRKGACFYSSPL